MRSHERIAVLQSFNEHIEGLGPQFPQDFDRFRDFFGDTKFSERLDLFDVSSGERPKSLPDYRGIIITGSPRSVNSNTASVQDLCSIVNYCDQNSVKMLGICFGHQVICKALGGVVAKAESGWNIGSRKLIIKQYKEYMQPRKNLNLTALHNEEVVELPEDLECLADCRGARNALVVKGSQILSTQMHPEIDLLYLEKLLEHDPAIDATLRTDDTEQLDADLFSKWCANFFESP